MRVFVGRVAVKELVLDQAREPAKFGNVLAEKLHLVHPAQDAGDLSLVLHDAQKRVAGLWRALKRAVNQFQVLPNLRPQLRAQLDVALLHVAEHANQAQRVLLEDRRFAGGDQAIANQEAVHLLGLARAAEQRAEPRCFDGLSAMRSASALVSKKMLRECM